MVHAGDREDAQDRGGGGYDQQHLTAFGPGTFVRRDQGVQPRGITKLGLGHIDHERAGADRGCSEQCACRKRRSASCDQAIFVDQASDVSLFPDAVQVEVGGFGQRFQRRGAVQGAVWPVLIVVGFVVAQYPQQVGLVPDEGAVQELAAASADPAFAATRRHA
jgi:hypothetical protein